MFFVTDGCYGNVEPVHVEIGVIMTRSEIERLAKCRKHVRITVKRERVKETETEEPKEIERDVNEEYKEWAEEQFWGRL